MVQIELLNPAVTVDVPSYICQRRVLSPRCDSTMNSVVVLFVDMAVVRTPTPCQGCEIEVRKPLQSLRERKT
jgi:hypothetical protein